MRGCVEQRRDRIVIGVHPVSDRMHQAGSIWLGKDNPVAARRAQFHHCIPQTGWICIPVALNLVRLNGSIHVGFVALDAHLFQQAVSAQRIRFLGGKAVSAIDLNEESSQAQRLPPYRLS